MFRIMTRLVKFEIGPVTARGVSDEGSFDGASACRAGEPAGRFPGAGVGWRALRERRSLRPAPRRDGSGGGEWLGYESGYAAGLLDLPAITSSQPTCTKSVRETLAR